MQRAMEERPSYSHRLVIVVTIRAWQDAWIDLIQPLEAYSGSDGGPQEQRKIPVEFGSVIFIEKCRWPFIDTICSDQFASQDMDIYWIEISDL